MSKKKKLPPYSSQTPPQHRPIETVAQFAITAQRFSGPLPPPEILRKYEELLPGSADRIISMAEKQGNHRQDLEKKFVWSNCANERLGMILGFTICVLAISAGAYLVMKGKDVSGIAAIITALAAPLAAFIYGKRRQNKELQERQEAVVEAARHTPSN